MINAEKETKRGVIGISHQTQHATNNQTSEHYSICTNMNGQVSVYTPKTYTHTQASINTEITIAKYNNVITVHFQTREADECSRYDKRYSCDLSDHLYAPTIVSSGHQVIYV